MKVLSPLDIISVGTLPLALIHLLGKSLEAGWHVQAAHASLDNSFIARFHIFSGQWWCPKRKFHSDVSPLQFVREVWNCRTSLLTGVASWDFSEKKKQSFSFKNLDCEDLTFYHPDRRSQSGSTVNKYHVIHCSGFQHLAGRSTICGHVRVFIAPWCLAYQNN